MYFPHVDTKSVRSFYNKVKRELIYRPLEQGEKVYLTRMIKEKHSLDEIIPTLNCRTVKSVKKLLKAEQTWYKVQLMQK